MWKRLAVFFIFLIVFVLVAGPGVEAAAEDPPPRLKITARALTSLRPEPRGWQPRASTVRRAEPSARQGWLARHWKWVVPVVAAAAVGGLLLATQDGDAPTALPAPGG